MDILERYDTTSVIWIDMFREGHGRPLQELKKSSERHALRLTIYAFQNEALKLN